MSRGKFIIAVAGGLLLVVVLLFLVISGLGGKDTTQNVTLEFWVTFDDKSYYDQVVEQYKALHKNVTINFTQLAYADYEKTLINAFASQRGPDIFLIHNTWL